MADKKEPKLLKDLTDDELMAEVKKAVPANVVAKIGKSKVVKAALKKQGKK